MCNRYHMECSGAERIEVGTLWYGTKRGLIQCQQGISDCKMKMGAAYNECCSFNANDTFTKFSLEHKAKVMQECQGRSACHGQAPRLTTQPYSSYVWMQYACVQDSNLVEMCQQSAAAGSDLFLTFNITQGYQLPTIHGSRDCNCRIRTDTTHTRLQTSFVNLEFKRPGGSGLSECSSAVLHDSYLNSSYSCFDGSSGSTRFEFLDRDKELSLKHLFTNGTDDHPGLLLLHFSVFDSAKICLECFPPGSEVPPTSSCSSMEASVQSIVMPTSHFSSQQPLSATPSTSSPPSASPSSSEIQPTATSSTTIVPPASVPSSTISTSTKTNMTPGPTAVTRKPITLWPSSSVSTTTTITTTTTLASLTKPASLSTTAVLSSSASSAAFKSTTPTEMTSILNSTPVFASSTNLSSSPSISAFVNMTSSALTQTSALTPKSVTLNPDRSLSTHFVTSVVDENNNTIHTTNTNSQSSNKTVTVATTTFKSFPNYYTNTTDTRNLSTKPDVSTQSGPVDPPDDDEVGNRGMVIGVTIGIVLAVLLLAAILMMCFCIRLKRKEHVRKNYFRNTNIFYSFPEESDTGSTHSETTRELREKDWHTHPETGRKTLYESVETPSSSSNENYNYNDNARNRDLTTSGNAHSPLTSRMSDVTYSSDTSNDTIEFYNATEPVTGENAQEVDPLSNGKSVTFDPRMLYTQVMKEGRTQF